MLRRRIFSGAMASVMALSSVAVVASAEETQVKTKADLEKLVNETYGDAFRSDKLSEYGSVSAEAVLDALEAADAVLYDAEADAEDYTVAYMMVEATVARLVIHTAEELQALIDDCKAIYETNNIYNEELQDNIYTIETYDALCIAYDNATNYVTSSSSVDITEAYEQLADAKSKLSKMAVVSKSMFRSVMKQYEALIADEYKYEDWRRGSFGGWSDINSGQYWILANTTGKASFGMVWEGLMAVQDDINAAYESIDAIKTLSKTSDVDIVTGYQMAQDAVSVYGGWTVDESTRATKSGVNALLKEYHGCLVYDYNATSTTALYDAIAGVDAKVSGDTKFNVTNGNTANYNGCEGGVTKLVSASWTIKPSINIYVPVDANGYWTGEGIASGTRPDETTLDTMDAVKWQLISAKSNYDLTKIIAVTKDMVCSDANNWKDNQSGDNWSNPECNTVLDQASEWMMGWGWVLKGEPTGVDADGKPTGSRIRDDLVDAKYDTIIKLSDAYALAMDYLAGTWSMTDDVDTTGVVANDDYKGNSKEWALVYRYLKYALQDKYDASVSSDKYTKADVKALIEKAYELAELTGDAAIFEEAHMDLVEARQAALDWVKNASSDKMYKEYTPGTDAEGDAYVDSNQAYKTLWAKYEKLEKAYNAMKYSFGDIYEKLAEVSEMIDDGDLEATTALMTALDATAYALSVVSDEIETTVHAAYDENPGFDVDRVLQAHNRIITNTEDAVEVSADIGGVTTKDGKNPTHAALCSAYESLLAEIKAQTAPEVLLGDVDGNGTVNALDAAALLQAIVADKALDLAVADYDKSGTVNALDASAILIAIVNGTV